MPGFLTLYLPANGGLLAAVAHLAAAIKGGAQLPAGWSLTTEGFGALHTAAGAAPVASL